MLRGGVYTGISGWADTRTGQPIGDIARALVGGFSEANWQYVGAAVAALAFLAPVVAPRWPPLLFWIAVAATGIILFLPDRTVLHSVMYGLLPRFEALHSHVPVRVLLVVPLPAAMLAGATADVLGRRVSDSQWRRAAALLATVVLAACTIALERQAILSAGSMLAALAALLIAAVAIAPRSPCDQSSYPRARSDHSVGSDRSRACRGLVKVSDRNARSRPRLPERSRPFSTRTGRRSIFARPPARRPAATPASIPPSSRTCRLRRTAATRLPQPLVGPSHWLLVHNWGTWFGVADIQGYNPVQLQRYVEYIDALNGHRQEYHERDLFPAGLTSLLDLLNLRYLLVPADAAERPTWRRWSRSYPRSTPMSTCASWRTRRRCPAPGWCTRLSRWRPARPSPSWPRAPSIPAAPRCWRRLPPRRAPADPAAETVRLTQSEPDRLELAVRAEAPGLLVLSEVWDPGWRATVSGVSAPVLLADHTLRAVPVPAGQHTVVLSYDPPLLRVGIAITLATTLLLLALWGGLIVRERRRSAITPGTPDERVTSRYDPVDRNRCGSRHHRCTDRACRHNMDPARVVTTRQGDILRGAGG